MMDERSNPIIKTKTRNADEKETKNKEQEGKPN